MDGDRGSASAEGCCWTGRASLSFLVPTEPHAVRAVRKTIESFAADRGFSPTKVQDLSLAVAEALFNAMEHGNQGLRAIGIDVDFSVDFLEIAVEDDGVHGDDDVRFEELRQALDCDADEPPELDLERGRGLFLIRAKSDEVRVERAREGGVRVVMVKRR